MKTPHEIARHRQHREAAEKAKLRKEIERKVHCPRPPDDEDRDDERDGDLEAAADYKDWPTSPYSIRGLWRMGGEL